jgi:hypothetical protein
MHLKVGGCMSCVAGCCVGRCREDYARFTQKGKHKHCKAAQGASRASLTACFATGGGQDVLDALAA